MYLVRQNFPDRSLPDPAAETRRRLAAAGLERGLAPGAEIAIGAGSRGIANLAEIVRAVVDHFRERGFRPFLVPAMGSHGGATPEGQAAVLAHYGITESSMGCPVRSSLETVKVGTSEEGIETFVDRLAFESDGIVVVNRVKWHTDFQDRIESGLLKMIAIGLGKQTGARRYHIWAEKLGLGRVVRSVGRRVLATGKVLGGVAILEDARHNTARIEAVPAAELEAREEELLELALSWKPNIPADAVDLLILDEIGKNISGAGMDTKIVNRSSEAVYNPWPETPRIRRIFVRDLHPLSYGNALGIGFADVTTDRLVEKIDWEATVVNALTSSKLAPVRVPLHYPDDRRCLEAAVQTTGRLELRDVTYCWIRNTLELERAAVSETLLEAVEANPRVEVESGPHPLRFDEAGNLISPFGLREAAA